MGFIAKKVSVERVGKTDHYTNAAIFVSDAGILSVATKRPSKRVLYAPGRWSTVTEEGVSETAGD